MKSGVDCSVLLVDDDADIREILSLMLAEEGYGVAAAATGIEALDYLRQADRLPDVILLDLMMPVMDGWQFRAAQKQNAVWSTIPVVVVSADGNVEEHRRSIDAHAYLRKPLHLQRLLEILAVVRGNEPTSDGEDKRKNRG